MALRISFSRARGHHAVRKLKSSAKRQGVTLTNCVKNPHGYYITCEAPCSASKKLGQLKAKRSKFSGIVDYSGCDR